MPNPIRPLLTVLRSLRERIDDLPIAGEEYPFEDEPERAKALIYIGVFHLAWLTKESLKQTYSAQFETPWPSTSLYRRVLVCLERLGGVLASLLKGFEWESSYDKFWTISHGNEEFPECVTCFRPRGTLKFRSGEISEGLVTYFYPGGEITVESGTLPPGFIRQVDDLPAVERRDIDALDRLIRQLEGIANEIDRESGEASSSSESRAASDLVAEMPAVANDTRSRNDQASQRAAGMAWKEAADRMERLRSQGGPWTSQQNMAKRLGCSSSTINKAIHETPSLQAWAKGKVAARPRAQSLNDVVTDRTAESRELDPADEAALREFIEKADPETKTWFLALSLHDQLAHLDDPDKHDRIFGRKP